MAGCRATCGHRAIVTDYRQERQRQEQVAEDASGGYDTELREWLRDNHLITFREWLIGTRRPG